MVVIDADFAPLIVVADIVVIRLRQRNVNHAENQDADSQGSRSKPVEPPPKGHELASFWSHGGCAEMTDSPDRGESLISFYYETAPSPGQASAEKTRRSIASLA
jgi:hypothetical protein